MSSLKLLFFIMWICSAYTYIMSNGDTGQTSPNKPIQKHVIIWIHGTKLTPTPVWHTFFFRLEGLHSITEYDSKYHLYKIAESFVGSDSAHTLEHFYVFGWSGKLSFKERLSAARNLLESLEKLNQEYTKKYGCAPLFTVITHSHGGNVALNMVKTKDTFSSDFSIDRLILLACPVQDETKDCIANPFFNRVISFYSSADMIQVIDPQGLYRNEKKATSLFSQRMFPHHEKLTQIKSMRTKRGLMHIEFISPKFVQHIPKVLQELSDLSHKHPDSYHCLFDLNPERSIFKNPMQRAPFSLSVCTA